MAEAGCKNRIRKTAMTILVCGTASVVTVAAEEIRWARDVLERAAIYVPVWEEPPVRRPPPVNYVGEAAADLREFVLKMTGVDLPLHETDDVADIPADRPAFILGRLATELGVHAPKTEFREDGYRIEVRDRQVLLAGEGEPGSAYAVYDLLYRQGVRFYMPGPFGEEVPTREDLVLPSEPVEEAPDWEDRRLWINGGAANQFPTYAPNVRRWHDQWNRRNRAGGGPRRVLTGHMWEATFRLRGLPRNEAMEQHPEWFAKIDGRLIRTPNLMSDGLVDHFAQHYLEILKNDPPDTRRIVSANPDDGMIRNERPEARHLLARSDITFRNAPDATDYVIQFNNRVLAKVKEHYPHVRFALPSYANYQNAPQQVMPDPNIVLFFAPLNFSRYHSLVEPDNPSRALLAELVERWSRTGVQIGWRDYAFLCPDVLMPFNRLHMTSRDIPWLHERGARYISTETAMNWPNLLPEYYLLARLLWDVNLDQQALLDEFYARFFGAAGAAIRQYVDAVSESYERLPFSAGNKEFVESVFTPEHLATLRRHMEAAKAAVADDEVRAHRVRLMETALLQGERFMAMRAAVNRFDYDEAARLNAEIRQAFIDDIAFDPHSNTMFVRDNWYHRVYGSRIDQVHEWLQNAEILHVFPDEWPAHFDLTKTGEMEGLFRPGSSAFDFMMLKTYSRCLAEQGWEKFRGDIWYRQTFPAPTPAGEQPVHLLFAGVDRQVKAWINGREVAERDAGRDLGGVLLIPIEDIAWQEQNTLVVRVNNDSPSELGTGGIIRPVALIARPPKTED